MTYTILVVGDRNTGRSVLAGAQLARDLRRIWPKSADDVEVRTAGIVAADGAPVAPHTETVAIRRGFDVAGEAATPLTPELVEQADLVLTMSRRLRAAVLLQFPHVRTRVVAMLELAALLRSAAAVRRRQPLGRGERLGTKLRLAVAAAVSRRAAMQPAVDDGRWDIFDPYAYSLDVYETVATAIEDASHRIVGDVAVITGARQSADSAFRTA